MKRIAILIPCYNEGLTIARVVSDFKSQLPEATVYVFDNNSTDNTASEALAAGATVCSEPGRGKGNVIRSMFRQIDADCYLMVDGDDTYSAQHAAEMCRMVLDDGADMVIGNRLSSTYLQVNRRPFHNVGNLLVPVYREYLATGLVPRFPTLIGSGFILLFAIIMWVSGLILEVIAKKHRQLYELLLNRS